MDFSRHPIFSNVVIMEILRKYFSPDEWGHILCALSNPLQDPSFEMCVYCKATDTITIGRHYN